MKPAPKNSLVNLARRQRAWYRLRLGRLLLEEERARLEEILPNLFGYHLLQIGRMADTDLLLTSRITHRIVIDADGDTNNAMPGLVACPDALPIASDSVDVVILPHTLELEADPHQVLREVERVLIAEGSLVIAGFNPWSLWGLWRLVLARGGYPPWCGRFISLVRIRDWLALLGFDEVQVQPYFFRPPLHHEGLMKKLNFMERLGARGWPQLSGAYLLVAKKRVSTLTPIMPNWSRERRVVNRGLEPTTRNMNHE